MPSITVDTRATIQGLDNLHKQFLWANVSALNTLANTFQRTQQELLAREFTLRQARFIQNTIKRLPGQDFATKQNPVATVRVDPERDFLSKFEQGGTKHAIQGKDYVAIPLPALRRSKKGLVPKSLLPRAFKPWEDKPGGITLGAQRSFIVPTKSGNRLLLQRFGGARGKKGIRALYLFVPSVRIDARLHFQETAVEVAKSAWARIFAQSWANALSTARP